jgi:hypothetical protein
MGNGLGNDGEREFNGRPATNCKRSEILERAAGIEPAYTAWEAVVLPLNYARKPLFFDPLGTF